MAALIRQVEVYVCAPQCDMGLERQALYDLVFPELIADCPGESLRIVPIDLRCELGDDGVQSAEGLAQCLAGIDRCSFFLAILGENHGGPTAELSDDLLQRYPWIGRHFHRTALELEILHALCYRANGPLRSLFYFRRTSRTGLLDRPDYHVVEHEPGDSASSIPPPGFGDLAVFIRRRGRTRRFRFSSLDSGATAGAPLNAIARMLVNDLREAIRKAAAFNQTDAIPFVPAAVLRSEFRVYEPLFKLSARQMSCSRELLLDTPIAPIVRAAMEMRSDQNSVPDFGDLIRSEVRAAQSRLDENVQFTVFQPRRIPPGAWCDLVASAHLEEKRADAPAHAPKPVDRARSKARAIFYRQMPEQIRELTHDSCQPVPEGGQITFVPEMEGVEFNPPRQTFVWEEDEHTVTFRMRDTGPGERIARGRMTVLLGVIIIAEIPLKIEICAKASGPDAAASDSVSARPYRKIFASYSHRDLAIVEQFEAYAEAIGDEYLRDWKRLRPGDRWEEKILLMIDEADVFQLFWSRSAMDSPYVRREYEHALRLNRPGFIRPVYWEHPFPQRPPELPPSELARLHFLLITGCRIRMPSEAGASPQPKPGVKPSAEPLHPGEHPFGSGAAGESPTPSRAKTRSWTFRGNRPTLRRRATHRSAIRWFGWLVLAILALLTLAWIFSR